MAEKMPDKDFLEGLGGDAPRSNEGAEPDPYLDQLDSSMEDLLSDEPTRDDIPSDIPPSEPAAVPDFSDVPPELDPLPAAEPIPNDSGLAFAGNIPVELRVVIGDKSTTLAEILEMKTGELLELEKGLDASVDLMIQDKVVARGELVEVDGRLGVRILRILEGQE